MRGHARLVIIGAGIVGCSAACHLAAKGWRDIVVLDQGPLFETGGSTSHAPGLVFQTNPSRTMTELARRTVALYGRLGGDGEPCFYAAGSMEVAATPARWAELKRRRGLGKAWGLESALLSPAEARERLPLLDESKILGVYYVPDDGIAKAVRACERMARLVETRGVEFHGGTPVTAIDAGAGRVRGVTTRRGRIAAEQVLLCAGIWGPRVGRLAGVTVPLEPMQHLYARTAPLPELSGETREVAHPILRHQDRSMYFRQHADCYGFGSYRHEPLPVDPDALPNPAVMPFTPEHFASAEEAAADLLPALRHAALPYRINGLFSFTADGFPLLGEASDVRGLWVAEAVWITHAGGVGEVIAEWMAEGDPGLDLHECDLNRFPAHALAPAYVRARAVQQYREVYDIVHPLQQMEQPRGLRVSPFHRRQVEQGAVFFETAGWERPQWFAGNERLLNGRRVPDRAGWEAREWSPIQGAEHLATRSAAALFDLTPFTKIEVAGPGALDFLEGLCANKIDQPEGRVIYTSMLNHRGGIMCDLTVTRLDRDRFLVLTGGAVGPRDLGWIRRHAPVDGTVRVTDVTSMYCGVGLWGPNARAVLSAVCADALSNEAFPYFAARAITLHTIPALALRVSYVGEMGWEIYAHTEYGLRLWDALWEAGRPHGLVPLGVGAFDSLRLEKGYRLWGADITNEHNPLEAGLGFAVKFGKGEFHGREALLRIKAQGLARTLCCLTFDDAGRVVLGKEPILDGERVLGYVTSANYGYTVGRGIAYGYLPPSHAAPGTSLEIEYFGGRHPATVSREPLYDPKGLRLRS
ncbi:MAG TPA: FAD-dependent oxidoreductase [bacterium]|nr:FAD-dependent oxidoreductase [bacterium]